MHLLQHQYGKAKVRVMKVSRAGVQHSLKELEVSVMLSGNFAGSYARADNSLVVATDTMKNTVYALAKETLGSENEEFGQALAAHFLKSYPQVEHVEVGLSERAWERLSPGGQPHPHAFIQNNPARFIATIARSRAGERIVSGIDELLILKTSGSGFAGFPRDRYTTLADTSERVLATKLRATWIYGRPPGSYAQANHQLLEAMLEVFATNFSPSVQVTLFQMGEAALKAVPEITSVTLAMPNKHCLLVNLAPFGLENNNEVFVPTDEPHGQIEGTVTRD